MGILLVILILTIGAIGYYLMWRDIKNPNISKDALINRPYYWILLIFIGGITTFSVGVIGDLFHLPSNKIAVFVPGIIIMTLYVICFLFVPRKLLHDRFKK